LNFSMAGGSDGGQIMELLKFLKESIPPGEWERL